MEGKEAPVAPERTILLVEDEAIIALAEAQFLKKQGYRVITAHNGEAAIKVATQTPEPS